MSHISHLVQVDVGVVMVREVSSCHELVDIFAFEAFRIQALNDLVRYKVLAYACVAVEAEHQCLLRRESILKLPDLGAFVTSYF